MILISYGGVPKVISIFAATGPWQTQCKTPHFCHPDGKKIQTFEVQHPTRGVGGVPRYWYLCKDPWKFLGTFYCLRLDVGLSAKFRGKHRVKIHGLPGNKMLLKLNTDVKHDYVRSFFLKIEHPLDICWHVIFQWGYFWFETFPSSWWFQRFFEFLPWKLGKWWSNLTRIFFKWVGSTTN